MIKAKSRYAFRVLYKPNDKREFRSQHQSIQCDIELKITKGDDLVVQTRINKIDLAFENDEEVGYTLVWTAPLSTGRYNIVLRNQRDIRFEDAPDPTVVAFLNPADLETRLAINEIVRSLCPVLVLSGIFTVVASLSFRAPARDGSR